MGAVLLRSFLITCDDSLGAPCLLEFWPHWVFVVACRSSLLAALGVLLFLVHGISCPVARRILAP